MVDFAKLLERKWIEEGKDPVTEWARIQKEKEAFEASCVRVPAIRVKLTHLDCRRKKWEEALEDTSLHTLLEVRLRVEERLEGRKVLRLVDGVTGHESFYWHELKEALLTSSDERVFFCAGTVGRWDALYIEKAVLWAAAKRLGLS